MKKSLFAACAALCMGAAHADTLVDFDSTSIGTYGLLTIGDVSFTSTNGFQVATASPGAPISGHALINSNLGYGGVFRADFAHGATSVSIGMGDYGYDEDLGHLEAYDAAGNLLDSDELSVPENYLGGDYLSVSSATSIAYVLFYETGSYPGAVYWDNMSVTAAVPEPGTYAMMALGLAGLAAARRRRQ